eukprot:gene1429-21127_t
MDMGLVAGVRAGAQRGAIAAVLVWLMVERAEAAGREGCRPG